MRKYPIFLVVAAASLVLAGCTDGESADRASHALPASSSVASAGQTSAAPPVADADPLLPAGTAVLVSERSGAGGADFPVFFAERSFTFYFQCTGRGTASLAEEGIKAQERLACDGSLAKISVIDNPKPHHLTLHAKPGQKWRAGVVTGTK